MHIDGENLHLSFCFKKLHPKNAMFNLVSHLFENGASFSGPVYGYKTDSSRQIATNSEIYVESLSDLEGLLFEQNFFVEYLNLSGINDVTPQENVAVSVKTSQSSQGSAVGLESILAILINTPIFSLSRVPGISDKYFSMAKRSGRKLYNRFLSIVSTISPDYASISVEWPLELPAQLKADPRSYALKNFFVNQNYIGTTKLLALEALFKDSYLEKIPSGIYVSTMREFNPKFKDSNSEDRIITVGRILASD